MSKQVPSKYFIEDEVSIFKKAIEVNTIITKEMSQKFQTFNFTPIHLTKIEIPEFDSEL